MMARAAIRTPMTGATTQATEANAMIGASAWKISRRPNTPAQRPPLSSSTA
jgi:hypothetical protein